MTLAIALCGFIISLGLAIMKMIEFLNENKKIEVSLSWDIDGQRIHIDNPSKKQFIISYWEVFWRNNKQKKILVPAESPAGTRRA